MAPVSQNRKKQWISLDQHHEGWESKVEVLVYETYIRADMHIFYSHCVTFLVQKGHTKEYHQFCILDKSHKIQAFPFVQYIFIILDSNRMIIVQFLFIRL